MDGYYEHLNINNRAEEANKPTIPYLILVLFCFKIVVISLGN